MGVSGYVTSSVVGVILLLAVGIDVKWTKNRGKAIQKIYVNPALVPLAPSPSIEPGSGSPFARNDRLINAEAIGLDRVEGPEDAILDRQDRLYGSTRDGNVIRFSGKNFEHREVFAHIGGRPLGMQLTTAHPGEVAGGMDWDRGTRFSRSHSRRNRSMSISTGIHRWTMIRQIAGFASNCGRPWRAESWPATGSRQLNSGTNPCPGRAPTDRATLARGAQALRIRSDPMHPTVQTSTPCEQGCHSGQCVGEALPGLSRGPSPDARPSEPHARPRPKKATFPPSR